MDPDQTAPLELSDLGPYCLQDIISSASRRQVMTGDWWGKRLFTSAECILVHCRLDFDMKANNIERDQTAP